MLRLMISTVRNKFRPKTFKNYVCFRNHATENAVEAETNDSAVESEDPCSAPVSPLPPKIEESERLAAFRKKLKEDMTSSELNRYNLMITKENDPLPPWPDNINPHTGEVGGPRGPEPTRYGDWERKGICVDF